MSLWVLDPSLIIDERHATTSSHCRHSHSGRELGATVANAFIRARFWTNASKVRAIKKGLMVSIRPATPSKAELKPDRSDARSIDVW